MNPKELKQIIEEGEGYLVEFKKKAANIDKEMVSFANGSGGRIFIGITDNGELKGIKITNKLKSQIQDIANNCDPAIKIILKEENKILVVHVRSGEDKPYCCSSGFYTRIGANAQKMTRNQIIEFFQSEGKIRYDELTNIDFNYNKDFDKKKLTHFLQLSNISLVVPVPAILQNLGVAQKQGGKVIFNNTGILFFAKNLENIYRHTTITCALFKGKDKANILDRKDFNADLVSSVDNAMLFLKQHIPVRYEFDGSPKRIEIPQIPFEALREAVINAVCHRNYFEKGANIMIAIFDDRVEISSPGGLVKGLNKKNFGKKSVLRNANIANLFHRMGYIEKMGTGIIRMQRLMKEADLEPIQFEFDSFVTAVFERKTVEDNVPDSGTLNGTLTSQLSSLLENIEKNPGIQANTIADKLNRPIDTIKKQIRALT
ncbi:MAG: putative DNA binding domain-containing protein, partial [Desulfobacula sp.]|nr:putative DNA binding domain-containing protein [Desulfobacula sp.]